MKAKLIINNQELEVEISEEEYKKLQTTEEKKTGYERVNEGDRYYCASYRGEIEDPTDDRCTWDDDSYNIANYYSSKEVAENNARADKLMRQLRRFAVEHREKEVDWNNPNQTKHFIMYDCSYNEIITDFDDTYRYFGEINFTSQEVAKAAIAEFHDELIWYFTEYKDSL